MRGLLPAVAVVLLLAAAPCRAQSADPPVEDKGTYLGVLVSPVPEVLYDHLLELTRGEGVVIAHILPESPAARAGLRRHDILLQFDDDKVRNGEHLARLINARKPEQKVQLVLLRSGKRTAAEATLTLGPVLKVAGLNGSAINGNEQPKGTAKAGGPPPEVSVAAAPLDGGKVKVTIEYYQDTQGRVRSVTCDGTPDEIATKVQALKLPPRVRELTRVALDRIRDLDFQKVEARPRTEPPDRR
jgi:membrane-associated protease RseP (regulator of RpoE activity)